MEFAGGVTGVQCFLNNGIHFFGFFVLAMTDAMLQKTKELRRLWFFIAVLLSLYNLYTRTMGVFPNEQISLSRLLVGGAELDVGEAGEGEVDQEEAPDVLSACKCRAVLETVHAGQGVVPRQGGVPHRCRAT